MGQTKIKQTNIFNKKISSKIVLISDIHYSSKNDLNKLNKILDKIKMFNSDYICILGDTCDQAKILDEDLLIDWLKRLSKISRVFMVYGNHDLAIYKTHSSYFNEKLFNKIKKIDNLYLLDNELKDEEGICFIGLNLGFDYYYKNNENEKAFIKKYNKLVKKLNSNNYNILLSHSPITLSKNGVINKLNDYENIDLILCGHMHGGIMPDILRPIFKNSGLISPNGSGLFVKNAYGNFKIENINFVVSSGVTKLSNVSKLSRFDKLFSPEIMVVNVNK